MPHSLTPQMLAQTQAQASMPIVFIEVDTPAGNVYFWTGYGSISWNGQTWVGAGYLLKFQNISEVNMTQASGVIVSLSGIPTSLISLVLGSLKRYYPAKIWIGALDENFAVIPDPYEVFYGLTDAATMTTSGTTATIDVTFEGRLVALRTPKERRYTDDDQRIEHPQDGGFKFVEFLQSAIITWGAGSS